jgi:hypothetical protein
MACASLALIRGRVDASSLPISIPMERNSVSGALCCSPASCFARFVVASNHECRTAGHEVQTAAAAAATSDKALLSSALFENVYFGAKEEDVTYCNRANSSFFLKQ